MLSDHEWIEDDTLVGDEILWRGVTALQTEIEPATGRVIPVEGAFRSQEVSMNVAAERGIFFAILWSREPKRNKFRAPVHGRQARFWNRGDSS